MIAPTPITTTQSSWYWNIAPAATLKTMSPMSTNPTIGRGRVETDERLLDPQRSAERLSPLGFEARRPRPAKVRRHALRLFGQLAGMDPGEGLRRSAASDLARKQGAFGSRRLNGVRLLAEAVLGQRR